MLEYEEAARTFDGILSEQYNQASNEDRQGYDSDHIDSEIEAELYSQIHHECISNAELNVQNLIVKKRDKRQKSVCGKKSKTVERLKSFKNRDSDNSSFLVSPQPPELTASGKKRKAATSKDNSDTNWKVIGSGKLNILVKDSEKLEESETSSVTFSLFKNLGLSKMTDSECEIIRVGKVEDGKKDVPVVIVDSSSDSDCIIESVFEQSKDVKINAKNLDEMLDNNNAAGKRNFNRKRERNQEKRKRKRKKTKCNDEEVNQDIWKVNMKDQFYSTFKKTTAYKQQAALNRVICYNCRVAGHLSKNCSSTRRFINCYVCGNEGHHGDRCTNPVCPKCLIIGHSLRYCLWDDEYLELECPICNLPGHLREECPDAWRRYHLTLTSGEIIRSESEIKDAKCSWCHNCGANGHLGIDCAKKKIEFYIFPSDMSICSYNDPITELPSTKNYISKLPLKEDLKLKSIFHHKYRLAKESNQRFAKEHGIPPLKRQRTLSNFELLGETRQRGKRMENFRRKERHSAVRNENQTNNNNNESKQSSSRDENEQTGNGLEPVSKNESPSKASFPIENLYGWQKKNRKTGF